MKATKVKNKKSVRKTVEKGYTPVSKNIYFDGSLYRVRVSVNGTRYDKYFTSKKEAFSYRKQLLNSR
jgi:hypothetical protein